MRFHCVMVGMQKPMPPIWIIIWLGWNTIAPGWLRHHRLRAGSSPMLRRGTQSMCRPSYCHLQSRLPKVKLTQKDLPRRRRNQKSVGGKYTMSTTTSMNMSCGPSKCSPAWRKQWWLNLPTAQVQAWLMSKRFSTTLLLGWASLEIHFRTTRQPSDHSPRRHCGRRSKPFVATPVVHQGGFANDFY